MAHYPRIVSDGDIHLVISGHLMVWGSLVADGDMLESFGETWWSMSYQDTLHFLPDLTWKAGMFAIENGQL